MVINLKEYAEKYPCVNCGYCCQKTPCWHSTANEDGSCKELILVDSKYLCGVILRTGNSLLEDLAIGAGCCSPLFNEMRERRLKEINERF